MILNSRGLYRHLQVILLHNFILQPDSASVAVVGDINANIIIMQIEFFLWILEIS